MKLWQKKGNSLDKEVELFEVGQDYLFDLNLAPFDIYGNIAHVKMLQKIKILNTDELEILIQGFNELLEKIEKDQFKIEISDEDIHTKVENEMVLKYGDVAKKIHTARSRNDQVLVDTRLYCKYQIISTALNCLDLCLILIEFAKKYEFVPMPGYTHMQIAMPSSVGMWASSFVENFIDELKIMKAVFDYNNMNPLGSGAGYGVSIDIDREYTTKLLGFERTQKNSIYCGNSRGRVESHILNSLSGFSLILNRIATDLLFFTTKEFNFFKIDNSISTGSSIMPQKKNLDVMELIRGKNHIILSNNFAIKNIISNVPSGYNRDYQETKRLIIESFQLFNSMANVTKIVFKHIIPNEDILLAAHKPEIYATDAAYRLVKQGKPFRDAYREIGNNLDLLESEDPSENIKTKTHIGSTGNLGLDDYELTILNMIESWNTINKEWKEILNTLTNI